MTTLVEYSNIPESFALHWDLSACKTNGQFIFWDSFLDGMAAEYIAPAWLRPRYTDIQEMISDV